MSDITHSIPIPQRGRPYSATYRLWRQGHRIGGKIAWRLRSGEFPRKYVLKHRVGRSIRHHSKSALGKKWICFGNDFIYVRQKNGELKRYRRDWWLPYLATVWAAKRFSHDNTISWLRLHAKLRVSHRFGANILLWALCQNWKEVNQYMENKFGFNLDEDVKDHRKIIDFAMGKMAADDFKPGEQLEAASLAERGLGRRMVIAAEMEKKAQAEDEANKTKNLFLEKLDKIAEANENPDSA